MTSEALPIIDRAVSSDSTEKLLLSLHDGNSIEAVLIPAKLQADRLIERWLDRARRLRAQPWTQLRRSLDLPGAGRQLWRDLRGRGALGYTACLSTQVGCAMGCSFCHTARMGLVRNLSATELLQQLAALARLVPLQTLLMAGMGEPLQNLDAVVEACRRLQELPGWSPGRRQITINTCGIVPSIYALPEALDVRLALSLNATTDGLRAQLMPGASRWNIKEVLDACQHYSQQTRSSFILQYVLLAGVNDTPDDAARLCRLLRRLDVQIRLMPFNEHPGSAFQRPDSRTVEVFRRALLRRGLPAGVLASAGCEISAAYGQLYSGILPADPPGSPG